MPGIKKHPYLPASLRGHVVKSAHIDNPTSESSHHLYELDRPATIQELKHLDSINKKLAGRAYARVFWFDQDDYEYNKSFLTMWNNKES